MTPGVTVAPHPLSATPMLTATLATGVSAATQSTLRQRACVYTQPVVSVVLANYNHWLQLLNKLIKGVLQLG